MVQPTYGYILLFIIFFGCTLPEDQGPLKSREHAQALTLNAFELKDVDPDSSLWLARQALQLSKRSHLDAAIAQNSFTIAEICFEKGEYQEANSFLVESVEIYKSLDDAANLGKVLNLKGMIFQKNDRPDMSRINFLLALEEFESVNDQQGIAESFANLGHLYEKSGDYDSALYYNFKAREIYTTLQDSVGLARVYDNIGSVYEDKEEYISARTNFEQAFAINQKLGNYYGALINQNNIADTYRKTDHYLKALAIYTDLLTTAKKQNQTYQIKSAYRDISRTYFFLGDYSTGYRYLDSCYVLADQLAKQEIVRGVEETRSVYSLDQKEKEIELLRKTKQVDQLARNALIIFTILFLVIAFLIYQQLRSRIKNERQLFEAEKKLDKARKEQLESELRLKEFYEKKIAEELESMSKELTANALNIIRKNKLLGNVKGDLKTLNASTDKKVEKNIKKIINTINYSFQEDEEWKDFENMFQHVHTTFFEELNKKHPNLTSSEIRLCAMIRLNLNSGEMATLLGISTDSLRIARYRLRKKLSIARGSNLYSYVMSLG